MATLPESERLEYEALMNRGRDAEWSSLISCVVCGVAATVLLAWGLAVRSSTLMLPVVVASAFGYYSMLRGRQQVRLIAGYVEEFFESREEGARWFTWLGHLRLVPGVQQTSDWFMTLLSNVPVTLAVVFSWVLGPDETRGGELMPGLVTVLSVAFVFHSIAETTRLHRANFAAFWRQVNAGETRTTRGNPKVRAVGGGRS